MPRPSSSAKRQGAAHQRDTRHENGLVGPGKRVSKQKSQSQLVDGSPRTAADNAASTTHPPPLPAAANGSAKEAAAAADLFADNKMVEAARRASLGINFESSSTESLASPLAAMEDHHRRIDVNAAKNANVHRDPGPVDFALTVLRSCPLYDTLAILIILMQLPPIFLSSVYMVFTLLTFVLPSVKTSSGLTLTDVFDGTLGTPSLTTLVCMDIVMLLVWLFLWPPLQQLILDCAQVVIALTLGGGANLRQGSTNNIFICMSMLILSHLSRYSGLPKVPHFPSLAGLERFLSPDQDNPLQPTAPSLNRRGAYSWIRNIFAIHILTQGVVRYVREWYLRREKRDTQSQSLPDPEAGKPSISSEPSTDGALNGPDGDGNVLSTANVSTKKKRKQSAQVRIRQPLWAALASTKIVMVKEYELSHAAHESAGSKASDADILGNAPFHSHPEQIWISYVGHDEVCFNTTPFPQPEETHENGHATGTSYIDVSKPFYVKVNNATWQASHIVAVDRDEGDEDVDGAALPGTRWTGSIIGLTPLCNYECVFVSTQTEEILFSTSIRTAPAPFRDAETAAKPNVGQRRRHESPATTLKASITTQEAKLNDEKTKLKTQRKELNRKLNALKKEIEKLSTSAQSSGGNDEKLRQKIHQNTINQKQADQSLCELDQELKKVANVPEDLLKEHRSKQSAWNSEKAQFDDARTEFKTFKSSIDGEIKNLEEDQSNLQAKRNKIATRIAKADNDHARITDANARGLDEAERRHQERAAYVVDASAAAQRFRERLVQVRGLNEEKQVRLNNMAESMRTYLSNFEGEIRYDESQYAPGYPPVSWPAAPQGYPSNAMWPTSTAPSAPSLLSGTASLPPSHLHMAHISQPPRTRGRSSSMLSNVSGFTEPSTPEDEFLPSTINTNGPVSNADTFRPTPIGAPPALREPPRLNFSRTRGSSGSGSGSAFGSGSGSSVHSGSATGSGGSVRDPTSPV